MRSFKDTGRKLRAKHILLRALWTEEPEDERKRAGGQNWERMHDRGQMESIKRTMGVGVY